MMGVVYYANYFRYFEAGRNELLRAAGVEYKHLEAGGHALPVASASAKYVSSARYDDELELETRVEQLRFGSVRLSYVLRRPADDAIIATGETVHACVNPEGRIVRLPDSLRASLNPG
ncbi:MAG: acyl-CoA thioesterase [Myxococcales bacterium]|nr:acyl-CoA thioesterase [Myxococcales bacterium]